MKKILLMVLAMAACSGAMAKSSEQRAVQLVGTWDCHGELIDNNAGVSMKVDYRIVLDEQKNYRSENRLITLRKGETHFGYVYQESGKWSLSNHTFVEMVNERKLTDKQPTSHILPKDKEWHEEVHKQISSQFQNDFDPSYFRVKNIQANLWQIDTPNGFGLECKRVAR